MDKSKYLFMEDAQIISEATAIPYNIVSNVVKDIRSDHTILSRLSDNMLKEYKMTPAMIKKFTALLNSHKRINDLVNNKPIQFPIRYSKDIYDMLSPIGEFDEEHFYVIFTNRTNKVITTIEHSKGGLYSTTADVTLIGHNALKYLANGLITVHNHPSGNVKPSEADKSIAGRVKNMCNIIGVSYLDNIIIGGKNYYSFADEGML